MLTKQKRLEIHYFLETIISVSLQYILFHALNELNKLSTCLQSTKNLESVSHTVQMII